METSGTVSHKQRSSSVRCANCVRPDVIGTWKIRVMCFAERGATSDEVAVGNNFNQAKAGPPNNASKGIQHEV